METTALTARSRNRLRRRALQDIARAHSGKETYKKDHCWLGEYIDYVFEVTKINDLGQCTVLTFSTKCRLLHTCREEKNLWLEKIFKDELKKEAQNA